MISLTDQRKEAQRELALRKKLSPGFVQRGKLTDGQAAYHLAVQEAMCKTLERLEVETTQPRVF